MIVSEGPRGRFVIATPTKCGTTTLEEMARRHAGGRISRGGVWRPTFRIMDWEQPRRQHRMALPQDAGWESAYRYMMVRNPFTRYMSVYEYLKAPHNYSKFGAKEIQGNEWRGWEKGRVGCDAPPLTFTEFLVQMAQWREEYAARRWVKRRGPLTAPFAYRSPWVWIDGLDTSAHYLGIQPGTKRPVKLIRMERLWDDLDRIKARWALDDLSTRRSIHANRALTYSGGPADYWQETCAKRLWSRSGEFLGAGRVGPCGQCAACALGVFEEAAVCGYSLPL